MYIEIDQDGNVLNTDTGQFPGGEWYPDDTVIEMVSLERREIVGSGGVMRIMPPSFQAADWPQRAARQWNATTLEWESTGGQTQETDLERSIRLLENNEVPDTLTDDQVVAYFRHIRVILLGILKLIYRRLGRVK